MNAKQLPEGRVPDLAFLSPEKTTNQNVSVFTQRPKHMLFCLKFNAIAQARTDYSTSQQYGGNTSPVRNNAKSGHYRLQLLNGSAKLFRKNPVTNNKTQILNLICEYHDAYEYQMAVGSETNKSDYNSEQKPGKRVFLKIQFKSYLKDLDACLEKVILPGDQLYISGTSTEIQDFIKSSEQTGKITGVLIHQAENEI